MLLIHNDPWKSHARDEQCWWRPEHDLPRYWSQHETRDTLIQYSMSHSENAYIKLLYFKVLLSKWNNFSILACGWTVGFPNNSRFIRLQILTHVFGKIDGFVILFFSGWIKRLAARHPWTWNQWFPHLESWPIWYEEEVAFKWYEYCFLQILFPMWVRDELTHASKSPCGSFVTFRNNRSIKEVSRSTMNSTFGSKYQTTQDCLRESQKNTFPL